MELCCWNAETNCAAGCSTCPPDSVLERLGMFFGESLLLSPPHFLAHFAALWLWTVCYHPFIHPLCVCVSGGWVLTGIFLHLLIACRYTPYLNTEQTHTHSPVYSLSSPLFLPPFFMSLASFFLPFAFFFVSTHPFSPLFLLSFLGCDG